MAEGLFLSVIPDKKLQSEYNYAKITADPYNYTLSDRVLFYDKGDCYTKYNILYKTFSGEQQLADLLSLSKCNYLQINSGIVLNPLPSNLEEEISKVDNDYFYEKGCIGTLIKYNNLIINEKCLLNDYSGYISSSSAKRFFDDGYLKALEFWYTKCTSKSSLIPNLFYLMTEFKNKSLDDLENITFAKDAILKGNAPILNIERLGQAIVPSMYRSSRINVNFHNDLFTLGLCCSLVYGAEILYIFENIKDEDMKLKLEDLLSKDYEDTMAFCKDYLYQINNIGNVEIASTLKACFVEDNELRFNNFKTYFEIALKSLPKDIVLHYSEYKLPIMFAKMIHNMHVYAIQIARVKHAILLYKEAKDKGVLTEETLNLVTSNSIGEGLFTTDPSNDLLNLDSVTDNSSPSLEDFLENEKNITDSAKEKAPQLNTLDALKKDLYDSRYDFDIKYVSNDNSNKEAYYAIANSIKMITHNLAKQIKEIRTYNTGGKQNGLLVGKLDKKNLYRYKTDPKIFYNNNYKVKEMDLAFGCILDESGSMSGTKIKNGRIVMIMLHEVLTSLGINHSIIGHSGHTMYQSDIYKYYQFKEEPYYSLKKPYNLVTASARSCNCDSGALYYMQKVMKSVQNKDKIVIIFSDGQPTECTDLDLTNQVKAMEKDGIHVIGVGINFESIKDYYPDNANGKNLKDMVDIVVSILKRYVLEKKEE